MRRLLVLGLAFVTACSGGGGGRLVPAGSQPAAVEHQSSGHRHAKASLSLLIPKRHHRGRHADTISPSTQSINIAVNGRAKTFDTTPSSPGCTGGSTGTTCTLQLEVPFGDDTFIVTTYSALGGGGFILDRATIDVNVNTKTTQIAI
ncbi:MAG TPA: hypothetical protein VK760_08765, partial [Candidatus Acidoferrales bacterium]|nr:hypothetical protein [Candidatus Acidoferrales bacterium]